MNSSTATCPQCEGRGVLYHGAPDALGTATQPCGKCEGTGEVSAEVAETARKQYRKSLAREVAFERGMNPTALEKVYVAGLTVGSLRGSTVEVEVLENKSLFVERGPSDIYLNLATGERVKIDHYSGENARDDEGSRRRMSKYSAATYFDHVRVSDTKEYKTPEKIKQLWSQALGLEQSELAVA